MSLKDILIEYRVAFLSGLEVTIELCALVWVIGILCGTLFGALNYRFKIFKITLSTLSTLITGVPIIVLLFWMYYPLQELLSIDIDPFYIALIAFSTINTFIVSNLVYSALSTFPKAMIWSARVSGLSSNKILFKIQFPLILRQLIGPVLLVQISMLHNSIFASLINVDDIFRQIQRINAIVYKPIELYTLLAVFFIIISVPVYLLANYLKRKDVLSKMNHAQG